MEKQSNKFLKIASILMIIGGGFNIILGTIAVLGVGVLALALGNEAKMGLLMMGSLLVLVSAIVSLIAGIIGVKSAAIPEKAGTCIKFGILTGVFAVLGSSLSTLGGKSFNFLSLLIGLVIPALYLIGAFQNKSLIDTNQDKIISE